MKILKSLVFIFGSLYVGELISNSLSLPLPGSIVGMLIFALLLKVGACKEEEVGETSDFLIKNMSLFFIPPGVGVISYFGLIREQWLPIVASAVISTILVILSTAIVFQIIKNKKRC